MLRGLTGSKYDHVGMLIKYPNTGQLVLFESLFGTGVCRWDWSTLHKQAYWRNNYSKVVYRRLLGVERNEDFRQTVLKFMKKTLGHPYELNVNKIMRRDIAQDMLENGDFRPEKGFFCSELIAYLFMQLKLIKSDRPASHFWPGNFSSENSEQSIKLNDDAFFSEEFTLDLTS